jgi:hypothetical protein
MLGSKEYFENMKLYKYVKQERIDVVRDRMIRLTPPGYLNDPFECRLSFKTLTENEQDEHIRSWRKCASIQYGILCLTKRPDSHVMWAHYGEAHRGFILEFESDNSFFKDQRYEAIIDWKWFGEGPPLVYPGFGTLKDVSYSDDRPCTDNPEEIPFESFFVKSKDWAYEEEVRMILPLHAADKNDYENWIYLFKFPPTALTGIILGAGASEELTNRLSVLVHNEQLCHVNLRKARLSLHTFGIEIVSL